MLNIIAKRWKIDSDLHWGKEGNYRKLIYISTKT